MVGGTGAAVAVAPPLDRAPVKHRLLLSVDGYMNLTLPPIRRRIPGLPWAALVAEGTNYTKAQTTFPSDSFPGIVA